MTIHLFLYRQPSVNYMIGSAEDVIVDKNVLSDIKVRPSCKQRQKTSFSLFSSRFKTVRRLSSSLCPMGSSQLYK